MRFQRPLKSRRTDLFGTPDRTHNRTRSPRLAASGPQNKVGKGSLQKRSVTSGKGLALRVGSLSLDLSCSDAA